MEENIERIIYKPLTYKVNNQNFNVLNNSKNIRKKRLIFYLLLFSLNKIF